MPVHKTKPQGRRNTRGRQIKTNVAKNIETTPADAGKAGGRRAAAKPITKARLSSTAASAMVAKVRKSYGLGRKQFAKMTGFSERAIGGWENGAKITEPGLRRMREVEHLRKALAEIMQSDFIPEWLETPNEAFQGAKPIEIIERGETGDVWRFIYYLESGMTV